MKVNIGNLFCYFRDCKRTTMEELSWESLTEYVFGVVLSLKQLYNMKKRIKYAVITILAVFIAVNIADFIMFQRFKSICKQEMSILNREDSFSDENNKK